MSTICALLFTSRVISCNIRIMAVYKVPQDVEADDKLLGPFSFRQFIYLIIVAIACFIAYILSRIFIGLVVVPLPFVLFFGALALPLRKDQPMEAYLLALVQFYLKPKLRLWQPDGQLATVEITAPKTVEPKRTKDISGDEASQRFSYLAQIMDTKGWASRGVSDESGTSLSQQFTEENQETEDVLDEGAPVAQSFDSLIDKQATEQRQKLTASLKSTQAATTKPSPASNSQPSSPTTTQSTKKDPDTPPKDSGSKEESEIHYSPYPSDMHQKVVQPLSKQNKNEAKASSKEPKVKNISKKPSDEEPSPDIINLANTPFTISTIAHEAKRIKEREAEEVVISLH